MTDLKVKHAVGAGSSRGVLYARLIGGVVVFGVVCRLVQFFSNQSYWCDESVLMLNVVQKGFWQLPFTKLDVHPLIQAAPPLFLVTIKGIVTVLGTTECAARLAPFLAGVAALVLFAELCRRLLPGAAGFWAVAFFALSDNLNYLSSQAKPYSGDALVAIVLTFLAFAWKRDAAASKRLAWVTVAASVGVGYSYTAAIVFGGLSLTLLPELWREGLAGRIKYAACNLAVAVAIALTYWFCIRAQKDPFLARYWSEHFVNHAAPWQIPAWLVSHLWSLFQFIYAPVGGLLLIPAVLGFISLRRTGLGRAIGMVFLVAVLAAALHQYPFSGNRLSLYLAPFVCILNGVGMVENRMVPRAMRRGMAGFGIVMLMIGVGVAGDHVIWPRGGGDSRQAIEFLKKHRQLDEPVYVMELTGCDCLWYWPNPDEKIHLNVGFTKKITDEEGFWIVMSYKPQRGYKERDRALDQPGMVADPARSFHSRAGDAVFFRRVAGSR